MAQSRSGKSSAKKSSGSKSSAQNRSSGGKAKNTYRRAADAVSQQNARRVQRREESTNLTSSVVVAGIGLFLAILVLIPGASGWRELRSWIFGLFGMITYIIPPFLLYLAFLRASGVRVGVYVRKMGLLAVLISTVPVVFSGFTVGESTPWQVIKMLFAWGQNKFWAGGVLGGLGAVLVAICGRPASNVIMLLIFVLGLMLFFAVTPADVVANIQALMRRMEEARQAKQEEETAYDTKVFAQKAEEESLENLTQMQNANAASSYRSNTAQHKMFDLEQDDRRMGKAAAAAVGEPPVQMQYQGGHYEVPNPQNPYDSTPFEPTLPTRKGYAETAYDQPVTEDKPSDYAIRMGQQTAEQSLKKAMEQDPLAPVQIGPGGTFGMDPLSQYPTNRFRRRNQQAKAEPSEPVYGQQAEEKTGEFELRLDGTEENPNPADELDVMLDNPTEEEQQELPMETLLEFVESPDGSFETPLYPVMNGETVNVTETTDLSRAPEIDPMLRVGGDTVALPTYEEMMRQNGGILTPTGNEEPQQTIEQIIPQPQAEPQTAQPEYEPFTPVAAEQPAPQPELRRSIPSIGGTFEDYDQVQAAWNAGIPMSELLSRQAADDAEEEDTDVPETQILQPAQEASAQPVRNIQTAQPVQSVQPYTADSFHQTQRGEAARLQVSAAVGNSSGEVISSPPAITKINRLNSVEQAIAQEAEQYCYPSLNLFNESKQEDTHAAAQEMQKNAQILERTLESFGVHAKITNICHGPSVTQYELQPQAGVKVSRITSLADDISLNLATAGVRIEAPIPGKPAVGIEVPNKVRSTVEIRGVFESQNYINSHSPLTMALGKDIAGTARVADLCKMPHLLIAGSTGSGKSVCVNSIIISFLFRSGPEDVKLLLIDPKVVELAEYNGIPHLLMPVVTEPRKAAGALGACVAEMERRYKLFAENNVREIKSYNKLAKSAGLEHLPYIAIVVDELADLMMVAGKEVEDYICRIAQKARAAGLHLIIATQRPSVDVITGLIKANVPSRIAFAVSSQIDSRTILDSGGAERLLGNGDMLFMPVGASKPTRIQGTFVTDDEISAVLNFIKSTSSAQYDEEMIAEMERRAVAEKGGKKDSGSAEEDTGDSLDPMFEQAVEAVLDAGQASTSMLQRRCKLGYARAARIMDQMEQEGIIGPYEGAKPRSVVITRDQWQERRLNGQYDND